MAHYKLQVIYAEGNVNAGFVTHVEDGGFVRGIICDENDNVLDSHISSTLSFLEYDLLNDVEFDNKVDTFEKNW